MESTNKQERDYGNIHKPDRPVVIIKKDGTKEPFDVQKVIIAIGKSAYRALTDFTDDEKHRICQNVIDRVNEFGKKEVPISLMHNIVEESLEDIKPIVAKSYRDYRNYKQDFVRMMDDVYKKSQSIMYIGDKENSNTDSALVATKRSLTLNQLNKELYQKFFMTTEELQACREGYIYVHDMSARRDTMNCFARETKFLTDKGVRSFMDFEDGDKVRVPSHLGHMRDAVVHNYGNQQLYVFCFELKNGLNGSLVKNKEFKATRNHRWLLKDGTETTNINVGDELIDIPTFIEGHYESDPAVNRNWKLTAIKPYYTFASEDVWCLEVEEDHSFLLEGGIPTGNCCLWDMKSVLSGGFEMGNIWYNEPKTLDTAFDVIGDVTLSAASQQYGGFTLPEIDTVLEPYAQKSYDMYYEKYLSVGATKEVAAQTAWDDVVRDMEQGFQGWEYKFNTVGSSRGDYPFITISLGLGTGRFAKLASICALNVRRKGQGKKGNKKPVLFPKIVFLYDENLHGEGKPLEDVFDAGIACSMKTMYPDWLSLTGEGYVPSIYKKYGRVISPMGCVDGKEIITYKFDGKLYVESFERMWKRMSENFKVKIQPAGPKHLYIDLKGVEIYDKEKSFVNTERIIRNTSNKWVDVHLSNGRRLLCTEDHPITTVDGMTKHACELTEDDVISVNSNQYSVNDINFDTDAAWIYGFMLCDGCYSGGGIFASIALDSENDIEEKFNELFFKVFGLESRTLVQERGKKGNYKDLRAYSDNNGGIKRTAVQLTEMFGGVGKKDRHIPSEVFSWNREAKLAFMAGMIDADGYFNPTSHGGTTVQIGSTNKELALQQMALAQALGMPAKIYHNHYSKNKPHAIRYRVEFFATEELAEYLVSEKKKQYFRERSAYDKCRNAEDRVEEAVVMKVIPMKMEAYSYDVTTESAHFDVSGIWSHNCRAFLSPWYEKGGVEPADENDKPVFVGRFNIGAVSLHLPMILAKSRQEGRDFYEVLDHYLNMIRNLHIRTYAYLGEMRASTNPLGYCEGGFYGGHLGLHDKIKPLLKAMTASFGITALNELQMLYNKKSLVQDGEFALEVMRHINDKINEFKKEDGNLYAIYGTPAENLCGVQIKQFRAMYGIVEGVSDREYVSNSFHCHVTEDITPIQKQDLEYRFWNFFNGGKIQYVKYPIDYNVDAVKTLVRRAMDMGLYEGVNMSLAYCDDCGHQELEMDVCPKCGSRNLTKIDRMNGYLSYSRVHGDTRLNAAKMAEIAERKSM